MKKYKIYGLVIRSEVEFEELTETDEQHDVDILFQSIPLEKRSQDFISKTSLLFRINKKTLFYISDGNKIIIETNNETDIGTIKLYILGSCMGAILLQRKIIPLHGSAIIYQGKGILVLGESGVGKSTLVSYFLAKGCLLVSDDVIPIQVKNNQYFALPGYPEQKLFPDILLEQNLDVSQYKAVPYLSNNRFKIYVNRSEQFHNQIIPIDIVFNLTSSSIEEPSVIKLSGMKKAEILMNNIFRSEYVPFFEVMKESFEVCSGISSQADIYLVHRPRNGCNPGKLIEVLDSFIRT